MRLANLRSGQLDFIERAASSDIAKIATDPKLKVSKITEIGYQGITINTGKSDKAQANPLGKDARVREAFELSLDREGIVQVVMDGEAMPGNQWVAPSNSFYAKSAPIPKRDVARAKALLKEAGVTNPSFTLMTATTTDAQKIAQVVQAMAKEAGFDVKIQSTEFATSLNTGRQGRLRGLRAGLERPRRSGRQRLQLPGLQAAAELRRLLQAGDRRAAQRRAHQARPWPTASRPTSRWPRRPLKDRPIVYLYHRNWLWAYTAKLAGVREVPDGLLRVDGLKLN